MQFLYSAFNGTETAPIKGKMSRWRHLESVSLQLMLLGLLFYLIMQNSNLRKQISTKMSHQVVQDIFAEKMVQLTREIRKMKGLMTDNHNKNYVHVSEVKQIMRVFIKQMGLPLPKSIEQTKEEAFMTQTEELPVQFKHREQKVGMHQQEESEEEESDDESEEANDDNDLNQYEIEIQQPSGRHSETTEEEQPSQESQDNETLEEDANRSGETNARKQMQENKNISANVDVFMSQMKGFLMVAGNVALILLVFLCSFILVALIKNPKYRTRPGETLDSILQTSAKEERKKQHVMSPKKLLKL